MSMRPAGAPAARAARCGPRPRRTRRSFRSPSTATASSSTRWSAPRIRGSWSRTAGTATAISTPTSDRCAGRTSSATSAATPTVWASRRPSASRAPAHQPGVRRLARLPARAPRPRPTPGRDRADPDRTPTSCSKTPDRRAGATAGTASSPTTCSRSGPRSGPSPPIDGIEPTNNPAERALRGPVIHRKLSLGTQSQHGERFAERALSAAATCRMQHRSLFTYLSELLAAHNRGDPFPALT